MSNVIDLHDAQSELLRVIAERDEAALEGRKAIMRRLELVERMRIGPTKTDPDDLACIIFRHPQNGAVYNHFIIPWPRGPLLEDDVTIGRYLNTFMLLKAAERADTPQKQAAEILAAKVLIVTDRERGFLERLAKWRNAVPEWQQKRLAHMWAVHLAELNRRREALP